MFLGSLEHLRTVIAGVEKSRRKLWKLLKKVTQTFSLKKLGMDTY